ncbi:hypothetical protein [Beijerinckia mobilis]|uniref:hypothetical protein n=1 Tax=Beijerinckia mobilis TaxID=231434 RepID=UPI0005546C1F|nr:hypothetical protein [Beijerinckia mobilis]
MNFTEIENVFIFMSVIYALRDFPNISLYSEFVHIPFGVRCAKLLKMAPPWSPAAGRKGSGLYGGVTGVFGISRSFGRIFLGKQALKPVGRRWFLPILERQVRGGHALIAVQQMGGGFLMAMLRRGI